jgi:energy-converting hydrogenase B subunit D
MIEPATRGVAVGLVALFALVLVRTRDPAHQAFGLSAYGLLLAALMLVHAAPDVALSQIVVGAIIQPLLVLFTLAKIRRRNESARIEAPASRGLD